MGKDKNHQNDGHTKNRNDDFSSKTTQNATQNTQFPQFLVMTSTQSGKTTAALSPLLLRKGIQGIAGDVKSVKPLGSGDLLIEVYRQQQAMNLLGTTSFAGIGVSVKPHSSLNCSKGVIRCPALRNDTDEDILAYFQEESVPVSEVRRMVIRRNNDTIKTNTFIITFSTPTLPQILTIGYQRYNVSVYIPNPLRCRNCQKYGHHEKRCRRKSICQYCGREGHTEQNDCDIANLRCVNCEGKHAASSRDCPTWSQEREILRVKYTRGVSFPEARRIVRSADITTPSYAQVTRGKAPVDSVTVKDASVQVSADIPAWGSQVPDMAGSQTSTINTYFESEDWAKHPDIQSVSDQESKSRGKAKSKYPLKISLLSYGVHPGTYLSLCWIKYLIDDNGERCVDEDNKVVNKPSEHSTTDVLQISVDQEELLEVP
ncbi:uncharacterized protein LOC110461031 [Mizuhopecten yessoensis]|uniref:uncharacterized protein LOC110461031 n=1 Tax=Mizuhopecten yessoensis TaxID=6573 RepID=UPI000B45EC86|nr:uncharacterized protein LOC110461031 [Mizuhopecten yessoensis]